MRPRNQLDRLTFTVTTDHWIKGYRGSEHLCAVAMAVRDATGSGRIRVTEDHIDIGEDTPNRFQPTPKLRQVIDHFDNEQACPISLPHTFEIEKVQTDAENHR